MASTSKILTGALISMLCAFPVLASDTLTRLKQAGEITIGVRDSGAPLSFLAGHLGYTGYHVELCQRILAGMQRDLHLPRIQPKYQVVTSANRIPLVQNGTVDMECGTTTNNELRQKDVAFALTTYLTNIRMVVHTKSGIKSMADLNHRRVTVAAGSTSVKALRVFEASNNFDIDTIVAKDHGESFLLLETGRVEAFVIDDNIAAGSVAMSRNPSDYRITGEVLAVEPIAIMLRKQEPEFKRLIDEQIRLLMASGELAKLYEKWFVQPFPPKNMALGMQLSPALRDLFLAPNDRPAETYRSEGGFGVK